MPLRIGITMRAVRNDAYPEERDALSRDWSVCIKKILPGAVLIPLTNNPGAAVGTIKKLKINGIILSGGNDWGKAPERDKTESEIVRYCLIRKLPVLGACRGMQVLNILHGGQIERDIRKASRENHAGTYHGIYIKEGSIFQKLAKGAVERVNSFHNQGVMIGAAAAQLDVFAITKGGVIEGFCHRTKPIIGIQWHPERENGKAASFDRQLISNLFNKGAFWK
ncbi:MAG: gamma-glutamyl-gamma-aminobutyrate hydrolase family protein [Candidatus Omnitrophica bacterium]|nr:gamma-glutamyl-gamma-aminobutyrate hydrolase family protein [Candidatus Omnitrophota bacterium]